MKTYKITIKVEEGNAEFWDSLSERSGVDEVVAEIKRAIFKHGFQPPNTTVELVEFAQTI